MTEKRYEELNKRSRQIRGVTVRDLFTLKVNKDAERFEFTPLKNGFTSYTVGFDEAKTETEAWRAVELAVNY